MENRFELIAEHAEEIMEMFRNSDNNGCKIDNSMSNDFARIPTEEFVDLCHRIPSGYIVRDTDVEEYFCHKYNVSHVSIVPKFLLAYGEPGTVPVWRVVSSRGFLKDDKFYMSAEAQAKKLEEEGLTVVLGGPRHTLLKVENYKEHLFDLRNL